MSRRRRIRQCELKWWAGKQEREQLVRALTRQSFARQAVRAPGHPRFGRLLRNYKHCLVKKVFNILTILLAWLSANAAEPVFSSTTNRAASRVVVVENPKATKHFLPKTSELPGMIEHGIQRLTGKANSKLAWKSLVSSNDVIGIKVFSSPGRTVGTRPEVVEALIKNMVTAGISPSHIVIWDKRIGDLYLAGFREIASRQNVRLSSATDEGWNIDEAYENAILGTPVWGDLEFEKKGPNVGRKSHVSKLLTSQITKIISVTPLLNNNSAGVSGNLYSLSLGSVDNSVRFESSAERMSTAIPEIYALAPISEHTILCLTDALICQYQGEHDTLLHYSTPLNQIWFSTDPVAADVLALNELDRQRERFGAPPQKFESDLYKNAALLELGVCDLKKITVERVQ